MKDTTEMLSEQEDLKKDENILNIIVNGTKVETYTEDKNGFALTVKYKLPSVTQKQIAEALYAKNYNKLLQDDDYLTAKELLLRAEKRGIWTKNDEKRLVELDILIVDAKEELKKVKVKDKKNKIQNQISQYRAEKTNMVMQLGSLTNTSVEAIAETERTIYMLLNCVFAIDESGNELPLYNSRECIEQETDLKKFETILMDAKYFWSGEGISDFLHLGD